MQLSAGLLKPLSRTAFWLTSLVPEDFGQFLCFLSQQPIFLIRLLLKRAKT